MFKNLKQMNSLISEMKKLTNDPNALKEALKQGLTVLNTPGTVDAGYDGEVKVIVYNTNNHVVIIPKGMKIAQAVLCPVINGKFVTLHEVIELDEKERGSNGFGSTGI